jgi:hypothetical protein
MSYWTWGNPKGNINGLQGVDGRIVNALDDCGGPVYEPDPTNPAVLSGEMILYALSSSQQARDDFLRIYPTLLPEEQARLRELIETYPRAAQLKNDDTAFFDAIQANWNNQIPVFTSGKRGGLNPGRSNPFPRPMGRRR